MNVCRDIIYVSDVAYAKTVCLIFIVSCFETLVNSFKLLTNVKCLYIFILYSFTDGNVTWPLLAHMLARNYIILGVILDLVCCKLLQKGKLIRDINNSYLGLWANQQTS